MSNNIINLDVDKFTELINIQYDKYINKHLLSYIDTLDEAIKNPNNAILIDIKCSIKKSTELTDIFTKLSKTGIKINNCTNTCGYYRNSLAIDYDENYFYFVTYAITITNII
jgi:hypothetical protein